MNYPVCIMSAFRLVQNVTVNSDSNSRCHVQYTCNLESTNLAQLHVIVSLHYVCPFVMSPDVTDFSGALNGSRSKLSPPPFLFPHRMWRNTPRLATGN